MQHIETDPILIETPSEGPSKDRDKHARVTAEGKHLSLAGMPYRVRGVTYGSFAPRLDGELFPEPDQVKKDFAAMEAAGLNTVRTYSLPPADVLETAEEMGLHLIVGLHFEDWRYETSPSRRTSRQGRR